MKAKTKPEVMQVRYSDDPEYNAQAIAYIKQSLPKLKMRQEASLKASFLKDEINQQKKSRGFGAIFSYVLSTLIIAVVSFVAWFLFVNIMTTFVWKSKYDESTGLTAIFTGNAGFTSVKTVFIAGIVLGVLLSILSSIYDTKKAKRALAEYSKNLEIVEKHIAKYSDIYDRVSKLVPADLIEVSLLQEMVNRFEEGYFDTIEEMVDSVRIEIMQREREYERELAESEARWEAHQRQQRADERRAARGQRPRLSQADLDYLEDDYFRKSREVEEAQERDYQEMRERYDPYYDR